MLPSPFCLLLRACRRLRNVLQYVLHSGKGAEVETATIREIQHNLAAYVRRVEHGEEIEIRRRSKVVARLVPMGGAVMDSKRVDWSDMYEFRRRLWGDKPVPGKPTSEIVYESRGDR